MEARPLGGEEDGDDGRSAKFWDEASPLGDVKDEKSLCANNKAGGDRVGGGGGGGTGSCTTPFVRRTRTSNGDARAFKGQTTTWSTPGGAHNRRTQA